MSIEWFRDLVIIICGLTGVVIFLFLFFRSFSIFKRLDAILSSLKVTSTNMEEISIIVRNEVVKPLAQVGCLIQGVSRWIEMISALFKRTNKEVNNE